MYAYQLSRFGGPEVLVRCEQPLAAPSPGQVRVKVAVSGLNFADTLMRQDRYAMTPSLPVVLGSEIAGVVHAVGEGVSGALLGQRVAVPMFAAGQFVGGYAEYVSIDAGYAIPIPQGLSYEVATALMVQGLTALYLLRRSAVQGKTVLITAAAGGVGSFLVQLVRREGAAIIVAAAGAADKLAVARELGADIGVNYRNPDWDKELLTALGGQGPDVIFESTGDDITPRCLSLLAPQGKLVLYGALNIHSFTLGVPELLGMIFKNQSLTGFALVPLLTPESLPEALGELFALAAQSKLRAHIGGHYPIAQVAEAHRALESRETTGKLVLLHS
jgi:NADPH2:quinone reductase